MKTKEQVKQGKMTIAEALNWVAPDSHAYGWLKRRYERLRNAKKNSTAE